jgi:glycosyltransferase involved in cell wall biosynthesis
MVWAGTQWNNDNAKRWRSLWGERARQVTIAGALNKPDLYAVLQRSEAAVLPSQVDNLPNTVIESLLFGIPVVGSQGASIDELVEDGKTGHLVRIGDERALAEALVEVWSGRSPVSKGFRWDSAVARSMAPDQALTRFFQVCSPLAATTT